MNWRYNTVLDNVAGHGGYGVVVNFGSGPAPQLRARLAGGDPGPGVALLLFPSGARPWCRRDGEFAWRRGKPIEDLSSARHRLCGTRSRI